MISKEMIRHFSTEPLILNRVKFEDYITVTLGERDCSSFAIPADLPDGKQLGRAIDESCFRAYMRVMDQQPPSDQRPRMPPQIVDQAFSEIVLNSATYKKHLSWAEKLGLSLYQAKITPAMHEIYIYKGWRKLWKLRSLLKLRAKYKRSSRPIPQNISYDRLVFPEEYSEDYLRELGTLLGYPTCCVERYVKDRAAGVNVEQRASQQIHVRKRTRDSLAVFPYFLKDFFPCTPDCPKAGERGKRLYSALQSVSKDLGTASLACMKSNLERVEQYPELLKAHDAEMRKRLQEYQARMRLRSG